MRPQVTHSCSLHSRDNKSCGKVKSGPVFSVSDLSEGEAVEHQQILQTTFLARPSSLSHQILSPFTTKEEMGKQDGYNI